MTTSSSPPTCPGGWWVTAAATAGRVRTEGHTERTGRGHALHSSITNPHTPHHFRSMATAFPQGLGPKTPLARGPLFSDPM